MNDDYPFSNHFTRFGTAPAHPNTYRKNINFSIHVSYYAIIIIFLNKALRTAACNDDDVTRPC